MIIQLSQTRSLMKNVTFFRGQKDEKYSNGKTLSVYTIEFILIYFTCAFKQKQHY